MNPELLATPIPHKEAMDWIASKPVVTRDVFDKMLPEVKGRAFTITGLQALDVMQSVRDEIAKLPAGGDWNAIKKDVAGKLTPWLVDANADPKEQVAQIQAVNRRAELLLRTHGFQAYQASNWNVIQRQKAVFPYLRYKSMEDDRVRPSHAALDGMIVPVDSPFWKTHFPPWDWGCRCQAIPVSRAAAAAELKREQNAGGNKPSKIIDGARLKRLEAGSLDKGDGHPVDVRAPAEAGKPNAYAWDPGSLRIPLDELRARYADTPDRKRAFDVFEQWADKQNLTFGNTNVSVLDWLKYGGESEYERIKPDQWKSSVAADARGGFEHRVRGVLAGHLRDEDAAPSARNTAAEIGAVIEGRKPVHHEHWGDASAELSEALAPHLPAGITAENFDGHFIITNEAAAKKVIDSDPAFYQLNQGNYAGAVRAAVLHERMGELLGYGARSLDANDTTLVYLFSDGELIAGFRVPVKAALLFARERAEDYTRHTGKPAQLVFQDQSVTSA